MIEGYLRRTCGSGGNRCTCGGGLLGARMVDWGIKSTGGGGVLGARVMVHY